jgi:hypothetical protein
MTPNPSDARRALRILEDAAAGRRALGNAVTDALLTLKGYSDDEIAEMHECAFEGRD